MSTIILSIKPEYIEKILDGTKTYEYRTKLPKKPVERVIMYCTNPIKKVVGEFEVSDILELDKTDLWYATSNFSGITKDFYDEYFNQSKKANAYIIGKVTKYDKPKELSDFGIKKAPQNFIYISK